MSGNAARDRRRAALRIGGAAADRRDALIVARIIDDGATLNTVAAEFGLSRERIRQIVSQDRAEAAEELVTLEAEEAALVCRYRHALELVDTLDIEARWTLLAAVVFPSAELLTASSAGAAAGAERRVRSICRCKGCGIPFADGYSHGCKRCDDRRRNKRRRAQEREAASTNGGTS